jgi:lipopolysaccharide/colanic/teichoic acid biosynthesis glycosyltransferase
MGHPVKRLMDFVISVLFLLMSLPFWALAALAIKLEDGGSVFYRRRVVGRGGHEFDAFKFRTMMEDADLYLRQHPELWSAYQKNIKLKNDPRVTRVGRLLRRLSLDELPQLLNVLRGEMSLVGPRMITPDELSKYGGFAAKRISVKPGITGLWQVSGRQEVSYETRVRFDMEYIDNWSLWLDFKILARTIPAVLGMRGAY